MIASDLDLDAAFSIAAFLAALALFQLRIAWLALGGPTFCLCP